MLRPNNPREKENIWVRGQESGTSFLEPSSTVRTLDNLKCKYLHRLSLIGESVPVDVPMATWPSHRTELELQIPYVLAAWA